MAKRTLLEVKRVKTDTVFEAQEPIEITQKAIDKLNKKIVADCRKRELEREKTLEDIGEHRIK